MAPPGRYFFVHVMKTAGITLGQHIAANFAPAERYPEADDPTGGQYWVIDKLRAAIEARGPDVRIWQGHFPYYVTAWVPDATTLTLLRHPVDRVISLLDQRVVQNQLLGRGESTAEELYDDPSVFSREIHNHMTKIFSLRPADGAATYLHPLDPAPHRLDEAKRALEAVDLVGFQEDFSTFLAELRQRWAWHIGPVEPRNTGPDVAPAPAAFRRRIAADNELDLELYEFARTHLR